MKTSILLRRFVLALCLSAAALGVSQAHGNTADKPKVHLVAVGDLDIGNTFGRKVAEDARNTIASFEAAFANADKEDQLKTHLVVGGAVTPDNVIDVIGKLPIGPNDTLVVLCSCHGMMTQGNRQVLTFHHGHLPKQRLLDAMRAKSPRLMVLLTDCCSGGPGIEARSIVPHYQPKPMRDGTVIEWKTIDSLLLRHQGLIDLTAAEPGFSGNLDLVNPGSLFTNALLRVLKTSNAELLRHLDRDGDGHMQWDEILPQLRGLAAQANARQNNEPPQQAYAISLGRWMAPMGR